MGSVLRAKYGCQIDILDAFVIIEAPLAVLGSCVFSMHLPVLANNILLVKLNLIWYHGYSTLSCVEALVALGATCVLPSLCCVCCYFDNNDGEACSLLSQQPVCPSVCNSLQHPLCLLAGWLGHFNGMTSK